MEVVLVLNNDAFDAEIVKTKLADIQHVKVIQVPEHLSWARVNQGVSYGTGDYYAKIDGDDLYGPRYISDMVCTAVRTGAHVL